MTIGHIVNLQWFTTVTKGLCWFFYKVIHFSDLHTEVQRPQKPTYHADVGNGGAVGAVGATGLDGAVGAVGATGGVSVFTGLLGATGALGLAGAVGATGGVGLGGMVNASAFTLPATIKTTTTAIIVTNFFMSFHLPSVVILSMYLQNQSPH